MGRKSSELFYKNNVAGFSKHSAILDSLKAQSGTKKKNHILFANWKTIRGCNSKTGLNVLSLGHLERARIEPGHDASEQWLQTYSLKGTWVWKFVHQLCFYQSNCILIEHYELQVLKKVGLTMNITWNSLGIPSPCAVAWVGGLCRSSGVIQYPAHRIVLVWYVYYIKTTWLFLHMFGILC